MIFTYFKRKSNHIKCSKQPLFFLFTCVKEGREYIGKLFDSLLLQTRINFVHFIYEDGSVEPLGNKIIEYQKKVANLKTPYQVIYEYNPRNIGLNMSTKYCISKCTCPYFIWIDCDNYVDASFFEEMEKVYEKNKRCLILRSILCNSKNLEIMRCNSGTIKEACTKYQLGLLIRRKYYYSFFAVNYSMYKEINPSNTMLNIRGFYNDEQILILCLLNSYKTAISKDALGFFTIRDNQESSKGKLSSKELKFYQLKLCELVNPVFKSKLEAVYNIYELYNQLERSYTHDYRESIMLIKHIKKLSIEYKIDLHNYYDSNLLTYRLRIYLWRLKGLRAN